MDRSTAGRGLAAEPESERNGEWCLCAEGVVGWTTVQQLRLQASGDSMRLLTFLKRVRVTPIKTALIAVLLSGAATGHLRADNTSAHPYYLQALADLRIARWNIQQGPGDSKLNDDETKAISEINAEISAIKKAAIDDNTSADNHPAADEALDHKGHLQCAMSLLGKIRQNLLN